MRRRRGSLRWVWLVSAAALIVGLVVMHHVPTVGSDRGGPHGAVATADHRTSLDAGPAIHEPCPCDSGHSEPASQPGGHGGLDHLLIHLCLAVLAAGVVLGGVFAVRRRRVVDQPAAASRSTRVSFERARPPRLTGVRLAELCVLRL